MEKEKLIALIQKAQAGDQEAMEEVLRTAHTSVSYQCRKLLQDPWEIEDITQEVLLTVYTKLYSLKAPEAFWSWLNRTTANRCIDALKRNRVEFQFPEDEEGRNSLDDLEDLDKQQMPDKALDNAETARMIEEIVDSLPDAQRICVMMYYYDEMSVKDIAAVLDVPENTVKSRLNYARKAVKEKVLDYEKKGVKLYGLSPLPFMLFFLLHAAGESADSAKATAMARQVIEMDTLDMSEVMASGGTATDGTAAGGPAAAGRTAAFHGISAKLIAGILAGVLAVGGIAAAVVIYTPNDPEPDAAVTETLPPEAEYVPEETTEPDPEPTEELPEETEEPLVEDERIPTNRLALLGSIAYYGDLARCRMTVNQALAYAEAIESRTAETVSANQDGTAYAALVDIGEGNPVLVLPCGIDGGNTPDSPSTGLNWFTGRQEVWQYADGQAVKVAAAHVVYWKEGEGLVCHTRVGGTNDENGDPLPMEAQSHYLDFSEEVYRVEGGVLSVSPIASALVTVDLSGEYVVIGGLIDGQSVGEAVWPAWKQLWDEGGQKSVVLSQQWADWEQYWAEDGWTSIYIGYDASIGGHVDHGLLNVQTVSPGVDAAAVLRQCAGE